MIEAFELRPDGKWWGPPIGEGDVLDYTLDFRNLFVADPRHDVDPLVSVVWTLSSGIEMDTNKNTLGESTATIWLHSPDPEQAPYTISCDVETANGSSVMREFCVDLRTS